MDHTAENRACACSQQLQHRHLEPVDNEEGTTSVATHWRVSRHQPFDVRRSVALLLLMVVGWCRRARKHPPLHEEDSGGGGASTTTTTRVDDKAVDDDHNAPRCGRKAMFDTLQFELSSTLSNWDVQTHGLYLPLGEPGMMTMDGSNLEIWMPPIVAACTGGGEKEIGFFSSFCFRGLRSITLCPGSPSRTAGFLTTSARAPCIHTTSFRVACMRPVVFEPCVRFRPPTRPSRACGIYSTTGYLSPITI